MSSSIVLGGGCFWCLDAIYRMTPGVKKVESGYAGGHVANPSSKQVYKGDTGHAEVVKITYDHKQISLEQILEIFFKYHDPTTLNRQGFDIGPMYRSIILYSDEKQRSAAQAAITTAQQNWDDNIVTEVKELQEFYPAEAYHQDFFNKNPQAGYCRVIINPKVKKYKQQLESEQ